MLPLFTLHVAHILLFTTSSLRIASAAPRLIFTPRTPPYPTGTPAVLGRITFPTAFAPRFRLGRASHTFHLGFAAALRLARWMFGRARLAPRTRRTTALPAASPRTTSVAFVVPHTAHHRTGGRATHGGLLPTLCRIDLATCTHSLFYRWSRRALFRHITRQTTLRTLLCTVR